MNFFNDIYIHTMVRKVFPGTFSRYNVISQATEAFSQMHGFFFIPVGYGQQDCTACGNSHLSTVNSLVQSFRIGLSDTHNFACRLHFRPQSDFRQPDLTEREYRSLCRHIVFNR